MENAVIYRILLLATAALAVTVEPSVKIEVDNTLIDPGSSFEFRCIASNLGATSFLRIKKTTTNPDGTSSSVDLAQNTMLSEISESIGRYLVKYEAGEEANTLKFIFTVSDARYEDSGKYACVIMGGNDIVDDNKDITVINVANFVITLTVTRMNHPEEQPQDFSSTSDEVHEYELDEHEPFHVTVHTSETNPAAELTMTVGDMNINDQFDISQSTIQFQDDTGLLVGTQYTVTARGTIQVDHSYRGGFHVSAKVANEEQSVGFKVKFSGYPPVIDGHCPHSIMAGKYQENVNFECTITSDEPVEVHFYYYRPLEGELEPEKEIILPGDKDLTADYHYEASLYEDREKGMYNVSLHMPNIYPQMFTEYTLFASNSKGDAKHSFTLEEAVVSGELAISVEVSKLEADLGNDVEISCHIINEEKKGFHVVWVKKVGTQEVEIGTNKKINKIFEETKRYSAEVNFKVDNDISDVTFVLFIKNVQASDSGEIGCKLPKMRMSVFKQFTVKVPFKSVALSSRHLDGSHEVAYESGETILFDEGEIRAFTCQAFGGYPQPDVSVLLGDKDISSQFNKTTKLTKDGVPGLYALTYDVELKNSLLEITYEYSKKKLECKASIPSAGFLNSTYINVELSGYKPQFLCDTVMLMPLHREDVNISCRVRADPPILGNMTEMYWKRISSGNDTILPGDSLGQFTAYLEHGEDEYEKVMTLHVDHIYMNHFQIYYFQATNDLGTSTHAIELRRAPNYVLETEAPSAGNTDKQVPGNKDRPLSSSAIRHILPGLFFTAILMIIFI